MLKRSCFWKAFGGERVNIFISHARFTDYFAWNLDIRSFASISNSIFSGFMLSDIFSFVAPEKYLLTTNFSLLPISEDFISRVIESATINDKFSFVFGFKILFSVIRFEFLFLFFSFFSSLSFFLSFPLGNKLYIQVFFFTRIGASTSRSTENMFGVVKLSLNILFQIIGSFCKLLRCKKIDILRCKVWSEFRAITFIFGCYYLTPQSIKPLNFSSIRLEAIRLLWNLNQVHIIKNYLSIKYINNYLYIPEKTIRNDIM